MTAERWVLVEEEIPDEGGRVVLDQPESRHLAATLRLRPGDRITLCDGRGGIAEATLEVVDSRRCEAEVVARREPPCGHPPRIVVGLGVLHGQAMDWAVQKCVETGVSVLVPLLVERSQLGARAAAGRVEHWRRAARQALKQCRRPWQMEIASPQGLEQLLSDMNGAAGLVADAHRGALSGAQATALRARIEAEVADMVAQCKLAPKADAVLHILLTEILQGAEAVAADPQSASGMPRIIEALRQYPVYFAHPGWTPLAGE